MTDPAIQEWLYAREVMRRLGFTADELFFVVSTSGNVMDRDTGVITNHGGPIIGLTVRRDGREFNWTIAATTLTAKEIEVAYRAACDEWNLGTVDLDAEDSAFHASRPFEMKIGLLMALRDKGFTPRAVE